MKRRVLFLLLLAGVSLSVNAALFWHFEHPHNPKVTYVFDAVWWWVVTSATVGYGDVIPTTWEGRAVAIVTIVAGYFLYGYFVAVIVEWMHETLHRHELGTAPIRSTRHVLICEYTAVADEVLQSLRSHAVFADRDIVIVSDLVSKNPYPEHRFVYGVPISPAVLRKANVEKADYVFVFANLRFTDPDIKTIHTAWRVMHLNPNATVLVELMNPVSDLLKYAPPNLIAMESRKLMESVLRDRKIDLTEYLAKAPGPR